MIHNHHQKTRFRSLTDRLCCIVVKETKILFNLDINTSYMKKKKLFNKQSVNPVHLQYVYLSQPNCQRSVND